MGVQTKETFIYIRKYCSFISVTGDPYTSNTGLWKGSSLIKISARNLILYN